MSVEQIKEQLRKLAVENSITCPEARSLAERLGVPAIVVGQTCNELKIKIKGCELGCFK